MKSTFITTVYNEEKTITDFLDSLYAQSTLPDEIIIVDAYSKDHTRDIIEKYFKKNPHIPNKLIIKKGSRSVGRNEAIKNAEHEIILCSDAGCILDTHWIKNLIRKFSKKRVDVVSGFYQPITKNVFEKCLATYTCVMPEKVDTQNFLPSSRSIAFRKHTWELVNGYPEQLDTCEDLIFDRKLKRAGFQFAFAKNALVYWPQRKTINQAFLQFFNYAKGDGKAFYFRPQIPFLYIRYIIIVILLYFYSSQQIVLLYLYISLGTLYVLWTIGKNYKYINEWQAIFILPILQIIADIAVLSGTIIGVLTHFSTKATVYNKNYRR